ncbi:ATP-grasp domain-containing protein [Sporosarcina sp. FA9]|uniref:ATP-grasp domain-containing protein n=1 Tax=Sporosarcina sp. FA9 TaxID=3413030 RepID=UPI003F656E6F
MNYLKTIIFINTNKSGSSRDAIHSAEQLGYFTVVFTNNEKQIRQREEYTNVHEMIFVDTTSITEMRDVIHTLKSRGMDIKIIISFIDSNVHIASILCDEFCQNTTSSKAIEIMENKEKTRSFFKSQQYTPKFHIIQSEQKPSIKAIRSDLNFPVIVKSPKSTGSKDVLFATGKKQLKKHIAKLRTKDPNDTIIIEEYIIGDQYLVEAIVSNGTVQVAAIIKQEITHDKRFIITGYGVLLEIPYELKVGIDDVLDSVTSQLGIQNGSLHLELRLSTNGWKLIEVNPRISGGAMNKMIQAAFGYNLVEETLKLYLGDNPSIRNEYEKYVFTQYVVVSKKGTLEKVTGKGRARKSPGVVDVFVKPKKGANLTPPLSMGHRYAYVIATGESLEEAQLNAKNGANEIIFHLEDDDEDEE